MTEFDDCRELLVSVCVFAVGAIVGLMTLEYMGAWL